MKILIADDDPQILRALGITLSAHGYEVIVAHDGRQAISEAASQHPDLIVLDLGMPHLTGIDVILAVRDGVPCRSSSCRVAPIPPTRSTPSTPVPTTT